MNISFIRGRLTASPFVAMTKSGAQLVNFTIANNDQKATETKSETAVFVDCVAFGKTGEAIAKFFDKGSEILVSGRLTNSSRELKDGTRTKETKIFVEKFEFIGNRDSAKDANVTFEKSSQRSANANYQVDEETPF